MRPTHQPSKARVSRLEHCKTHCSSHVETFCLHSELRFHEKKKKKKKKKTALETFTWCVERTTPRVNTLKQSLRLWVVCDVSSPSMVRRTRPLATIIIEHSGGSASCRAKKTKKLQTPQFHSGRLPIVSRRNKCIQTFRSHRWRSSS